MPYEVFICHSSKDKKIADAICATLEQHKIGCWIAPRDVVPGSDFAEAIVAAMHGTRVTVFVFSANSNVSPHVSHELERAVSLGHPIVPFRVEEVVPSPALEYFISSAHWLDALTPPMQKHIDRLANTVAVLLDRDVTPVQPPLEQPRRSRRTWVLAALGAALVVGVVVVGLVLALGRGAGDGTGSAGPTTSTSPSTSPGTSPSTSPGTKVVPFVDDFTTGIGAGWTWTNEDPATWRTSPQGWLQIDTQESPPMRNILLRDVPGTSYKVKVRLRFPPTASGFAGVVLMGDDPDTRMEYGWAEQGLTTAQYEGGTLGASTLIYPRDLHSAADRDIQLILEVSDGSFRAKYYDREYRQFVDFGTGVDLSPTFTHVGLIAYQSEGSGGATADFDRITVY